MEIILNNSQDNAKFNTAFSLLKEGIDAGQMIEFEVRGISMFPFIRVGDKIFIRSINSKGLRFGDIVVYKKNYNLCAHRYLYTLKQQGKPIGVVTKGDNLFDLDSYILSLDQLIGKIIIIIRQNRKIALQNFFWQGISYLIGVLSFIEALIIKVLRYLKDMFLKNKSLSQRRKIILLVASSPIRLIAFLSYIISLPVLQKIKDE